MPKQADALFDERKAAEAAAQIAWDDPIARARARIGILGDQCLADASRIVRAVNRNYQLSDTDWSTLLSEYHQQVETFTEEVARFVADGRAYVQAE